VKQSLFTSANDAFDIGFLGKTRPDLSGIYDLKLLDAVLTEKGLQPLDDMVTTSGNSSTDNASAITPNVSFANKSQ
jgi:NitT/TauT family transport system substrate-binding protein